MDFGSIISGVTGIIGMIGGMNQQRAAADAMSAQVQILQDSYKKRSKLSDDTAALYSTLQAIVDRAARAGMYDPEARAQRLRTSAKQNLAINLDNIASADRIMGYKPGDSVPSQQLSAAASRTATALAPAESAARMQAVQDEMQARLMPAQLLAQSSAMLGDASGQAASGLAQNAQYHQSQVPDFTGWLTGLISSMKSQPQNRSVNAKNLDGILSKSQRPTMLDSSPVTGSIFNGLLPVNG